MRLFIIIINLTLEALMLRNYESDVTDIPY